MKAFSVAVFAGSAIFLSGCSASGPVFKEAEPPPAGKALVYLYRPDSFVMGAKTAQFLLDGQRLADLSNNGFTQTYLTAGNHHIQQRWTDSSLPALLVGPTETIEIPLEVKAGDTYYVRFSTSAGDFTFNGTVHSVTLKWQLMQVPSTFGATEILQTRYQPPR